MSRGRGLRIAALTVVGLAALFAVVFAGRLDADPRLSPSPLIGKPAPDFELPLLEDDGAVRLTDYRGNIVVVNFFASWCLQCRLEHPDLVATADAFGPSGVQFIQIVYQDTADNVVAFLDELGRSQSTVYALDPGSRAAIAFGVFGIPETFFIDPDGTVVGKIQGQSTALILGETIDKIRRGEDPGQQVVGETQSSASG